MTPGKKYNQEGVSKAKLWKAIQGFGALSVALGSQVGDIFLSFFQFSKNIVSISFLIRHYL
jgi:hypothetical protein